MDLTKILSIAGKPGLYKMVANVKNGLIVESLIDQKRFPVFAHERISSLEEISIFTLEEDMPMKEVFKKISDHLTQHPEEKEAATAKEQLTLFETVIPNYDKDRVYSSISRKSLLGTGCCRRKNCSLLKKRSKKKHQPLRRHPKNSYL